MKQFFSTAHLIPYLEPDAVARLAASQQALLDEARACFPDDTGTCGWMRLDRTASEETLLRIEQKAKEIRENAEQFVLIGVGGSNNSARSVIEALAAHGHGADAPSPQIIYAGNSTAPSAIRSVLEQIKGKSVYINIIAKNFETLEPGAAFHILRRSLYAHLGPQAHARIIATGTNGSRLHRLSQEYGWDFFEFPDAVGGRYSAFTNVALLPMAVAGIDLRAYLSGAREMQQYLLSCPIGDNPALLYAAARSLLYAKGYRVEMLTSFEPRMQAFFKWWIQLFGESEGKAGKGLLPVSCSCSEELHSMGQFLQDGTPIAFETFLRTADAEGPIFETDGVDDGFAYLNGKGFAALNRAAMNAALSAHSRHLPCLELDLDAPDAKLFGALFLFFMLACVFSCRLMGVDPFDQPGVEAYKQAMFRELGKGELQ